MSDFLIDTAPAQVTREWLAAQAQARQLRWLLAHATDGVIWGEWRDGALALSQDAFGDVNPAVTAQLREETLIQARLFGEAGQLLIWRADGAWRMVFDSSAKDAKSGDGIPLTRDEEHLLWGDEVEQEKGGFILLREGREGLRHAPPMLVPAKKRRAALTVRHTLDYDEDGQVFIARSRLVALVQR
jgi:CRISPR-associated protein (TIGR03984 family)